MESSDAWKRVITEEWRRRSRENARPSGGFPLIEQGFDDREIIAAVDTLLSGKLTMGEQVERFEAEFARRMGVPYAVMVNSGSSANLLALAVASNRKREKSFKPGDEVLVPAVCWSTSVWPIIQMGLRPVFVDVDPSTLNASIDDIRAKTTSRTRGMVAVHVLGNSSPLRELLDWASRHAWILIEDTCESLGSRAGGLTDGPAMLGTLGDFGTFSFYYSHHITTGEGGMVTCHSREDYDLLKCLRAHGWSRTLSNRAELERANPEIDPRFLFVNVGYNLRPMEVQASFGLCQIERLNAMNAARNSNRERLIACMRGHPRWKEQLTFPAPAPGTEPAWFGFPALLGPEWRVDRKAYLDHLSSSGVENRPIISGNFLRQPALREMGITYDWESFPGAEKINHQGFFIGVHSSKLDDALIERLAGILLGYEPGR